MKLQFKLPHFLILLTLSQGIPGAFLLAQEEDEEEVFDLNPFVVTTSNDDRYYASNAISATQLDTPIKDIPFSLEVITSEFIEDTGATDFRESLSYSSGIFLDTFVDTSGSSPASADRSPSSQASIGDRRNNSIVIRGFNAPFQQRNGFRVGTFIGIRGGSSGQGSSGRGGLTLGSLIDTVNVDRSEILRGPGALLYGLGVLSGIVNVMPKQPLAEFRTEIGFGVGSDDYYRASLDTTGPIIKGSTNGKGFLGYRLLGAWQEEGDWTQFFKEERNYEAFQLKWTPMRSIELFAEYSHGDVLLQGHQGSAGRSHFLRAGPGGWEDPLGQDFQNPYGESYKWGAEDFAGPYPEIYDPATWPLIYDNPPDPDEVPQMGPFTGPFNKPGFDIFGPDTYYERIENSGMATLLWQPIDSLSFNFGSFYTKQETEELNVRPQLIIDAYGEANLDPVVTSRNYPDGYPIPEDWTWQILNPKVAFDEPDIIYRGLTSYWTKTPMLGESMQFRAVISYEFETPFFFGGEARHNLLFGRQDIKDSAEVAIGTPPQQERFDRNAWLDFLGTTGTSESIESWNSANSLQFHNIYNWTDPFRYTGQKLVRPGSDYFTTDQYYTGHYLIYNGKYLADKLTIIAGWRNDRFQGKEERWLRSTEYPFERTGTTDSYYNFEKPIKLDTYSFGMSYAINDELSVYGVMAEGVIPNTGQRDGNGDSIAPEQTTSMELGVKFAYKKFSGTISVFRIDRENAIWGYSNAPNPSLWEGGKSPRVGNSPPDPGQAVKDGGPINYGFNYNLYFRDLVEQEGEAGEYWRNKLGLRRLPIIGTISPVNNNLDTLAPNDPYDETRTPVPGKIVYISRGTNLNRPLSELTQDFMPYVFITIDALREDEELRAIAYQAIEDNNTGNFPENVPPLGFGNSGAGSRFANLNGSTGGGASVTFEEEATGFDAQFIFSPTSNLQFILAYAHVQREATTAFDLVPVQDWRYPELGTFSTEFDLWVIDFGEDAFEDPTDPTTLNAGIRGKSLYYGSKDSASIWGRYTFNEGNLEGFGVGLGIRYTGPAQTFVPIGSSASSTNRYPTPPTEESVRFDGAVYYSQSFKNFDMRLALNLYNIADKKVLYTEKSYDNPQTGQVEKRRTEIFLDPLSFRLSCTLTF